MRFDYPGYVVDPSPAAPDQSVIYRPVIRVRLIGPQATRTIWGLLDTGADECYITEALAAKLGMSPVSTAQSAISSASGELHAWYGALTLEVSDGDERHVLPATMGVVPQDWSEMILGRVGFLEHFDATFSDADRCVTLVRR